MHVIVQLEFELTYNVGVPNVLHYAMGTPFVATATVSNVNTGLRSLGCLYNMVVAELSNIFQCLSLEDLHYLIGPPVSPLQVWTRVDDFNSYDDNQSKVGKYI